MPATLDWSLVDRLFDEALDLDGPARTAFLDGLDAPLRARLTDLLAAAAVTHAVLDAPARPSLAALAMPDPDRSGQRVGPYRLVREIGRGGMGVVYLAERADGQFEQRVALKLLRRETGAERFVRERAVHARLAHDGIARLFDGGATEAGEPFFAMEFVDGEPIDAYCDRHRLPVAERLRLVVQVCRAVEHAHRNLVVHRDLKPSNILVSAAPDGAATVKLLDFGIAHVLTDGDAADAILTPEYAAPEQVRGDAVTTATDVYALGVVLYGLLTGRAPYDVGDRSRAAVERAVLHTAPPAPSAAVAPAAAEPRATTPARLARALAGDLDAVVLRALAKDPADRYDSPGRLQDDLEAVLTGQPVAARPHGPLAHARLFARRHRGSVAAAAAFVVLLAAYAATVTVQARSLARARDLTAAEARKSAATADFLADLFDTFNPYAAEPVRADTLRARALLDRGARRARTELRDPLVRAQMLDRIGQVYGSLGLYPQADSALSEALAARRRHLGPDAPDVAETTANLAEARWHQGDNAGAERLFRAALAVQARTRALPPADIAEYVNNLGTVVQAQDRNAEAEALHRRALALRRALPDSVAGDGVAVSLNDLAWAIQAQGRPAEAEPLFRAALAEFARVYGPDHTYVVQTMANLARVQIDEGHARQAERTSREVLRRARRLFPAGHPMVDRWENHRGAALAGMGRYAEAEPVLLRTHAALLRARGPEHFHVREARERLAALYAAWGRPSEAARWG